MVPSPVAPCWTTSSFRRNLWHTQNSWRCSDVRKMLQVLDHKSHSTVLISQDTSCIFLSKGFLVRIKWKQQGFFIFMYVTYFSYFVCVGLLPLFINVWQRMCNDIHVKHFCFSFHIFCDECRVGQHSSGIICFASHMNGPINLRFGNNKASIILS